MKATIQVNMSNAAFDEDDSQELARILVGLASSVRGSSLNIGLDWPLRDTNGNKVGSFKVTR